MMSDEQKCILVLDRPNEAEEVAELLKLLKYKTFTAHSLTEATELLWSFKVHAVIADPEMAPGGQKLKDQLKGLAKDDNLPVIWVHERPVQAKKLGEALEKVLNLANAQDKSAEPLINVSDFESIETRLLITGLEPNSKVHDDCKLELILLNEGPSLWVDVPLLQTQTGKEIHVHLKAKIPQKPSIDFQFTAVVESIEEQKAQRGLLRIKVSPQSEAEARSYLGLIQSMYEQRQKEILKSLKEMRGK